ncbi:MAG: toll/interleukin-1 receptor domain-containing protein [Saprospiraceae bacterium]|nr:toll/interleukin-1 receptor domain-containing protein [Saprospiraceae bacterium]
MAVRLFISSSPEDKAHKEALLDYLKVSTQGWNIEFLSRKDEHEPEYDLVEQTDIFIPLVSKNYLAHEGIKRREVQLAVERARYKIAMVCPILVEPINWKETDFKKFRILPSPQLFGQPRPLKSKEWNGVNNAFSTILRDLKEYVAFMADYTSTEEHKARSRETIQEKTKELLGNIPELPTREIAAHELKEQVLYLSSRPQGSCPVTFMPSHTQSSPEDLLAKVELKTEYDQIKSAIQSNSNFIIDTLFEYKHKKIIETFVMKGTKILHFSSAGLSTKESPIILYDHEADQAIPLSSFQQLIKYFTNQIECVLFSGCFTRALLPFFEPYIGNIIGLYPSTMPQFRNIFLKVFYKKLAEGLSYEEAYNKAYHNLPFRFIPNNQRPVFITNGKLEISSYE